MATPGECLEHVTKVTQAHVSYSRPLRPRSREVLYSTITQAAFYEKQEGKESPNLITVIYYRLI